MQKKKKKNAGATKGDDRLYHPFLPATPQVYIARPIPHLIVEGSTQANPHVGHMSSAAVGAGTEGAGCLPLSREDAYSEVHSVPEQLQNVAK